VGEGEGLREAVGGEGGRGGADVEVGCWRRGEGRLVFAGRGGEGLREGRLVGR
jgi:hypothetical protein